MGEYSMWLDGMKQFLKQSRIKGYIQAFQIEEAWEKIMGKTIAKYTDKIHIHGRSFIYQHNQAVAPLKNELMYQKEKIIERE